MPWLNVACDGWSDGTARCFNGYLGQGIDNNWKMQCIPFAFQPVKGSHTGHAIKEQYDLVCNEFSVKPKVFKIVADSASNNKRAFGNELEASDESHILAKLLLKQKKRDLYFAKQALMKEKECIAVSNDFIGSYRRRIFSETYNIRKHQKSNIHYLILKVNRLETEIEEANRIDLYDKEEVTTERPITREQLLLELDNDEDDETDEITDTVSLCATTDSEGEIDDLIELNNLDSIQVDKENSIFTEKLVGVV